MRAELSWTHYKYLLNIEDKKTRDFYINEAVKGNWSVRYTLPLENKQIYASKYMLYLPKEEDLRKEMNKQIKLLEEMGG